MRPTRRAAALALARRLSAAALLLPLALPYGCGDDDDDRAAAGASGAAGAALCPAGRIASCACDDGAPGVKACLDDGSGFGACSCAAPRPGCAAPVEEARPIEGFTHVATCSQRVSYATNPPSSGNHYPVWAAYGVYREPVPSEYFVHNLEHGAVVIVHNCPGACPPADADCPGRCAAAVAEAEALAGAYGPDPTCAPPARNRLVVTPLPSLDVPFAAASWGHTLRAGCFDQGTFLRFIEAHYGAGREDTCANGIDLFAAGPPCPDLPLILTRLRPPRRPRPSSGCRSGRVRPRQEAPAHNEQGALPERSGCTGRAERFRLGPQKAAVTRRRSRRALGPRPFAQAVRDPDDNRGRPGEESAGRVGAVAIRH